MKVIRLSRLDINIELIQAVNVVSESEVNVMIGNVWSTYSPEDCKSFLEQYSFIVETVRNDMPKDS